MQLLETIASLKQEREALSEAIITLERLAANASGQRRRGRPPAWMSAAKDRNRPIHFGKSERTGRTFSAAQRKEQAARMKKYWAEKKKTATTKTKTKAKAKATKSAAPVKKDETAVPATA